MSWCRCGYAASTPQHRNDYASHPTPRRMGAGRQVQIMDRLRAGEPAVKKAEVVNIVPKAGRSGDIFVLTMRHTVEQHGQVCRPEPVEMVLAGVDAEAPPDRRSVDQVDQIGDRRVNLMADARHHRQVRVSDCPRHDFFVKRPKIFE